MTILQKMGVAFVVAISLAVGTLTGYVALSLRDNSIATHEELALRQLQGVNTYFTLFFDEAKRNARFLAQLPVSRMTLGHLPSYVGKTGDIMVKPDEMNAPTRAAFDEYAFVRSAHPAYGAVLVGTQDGGFLQEPAEPFPGGYDPRVRGWYTSTLKSPEEALVSKAYTTPNGTPVSTVTARMRDGTKDIGVVGIDINLSTLVALARSIRFGQTGYVMLIEDTGVILSEPKNEQFVFKKVDDVGEPLYQRIMKTTSGSFNGSLKGVDTYVTVLTGFDGMKLVSLIEANEVFTSGWSMVRSIMLIGAAVTLLMLVFAWLVARSVTKPINELITASEAIAGGDFKALPDARHFSGELLSLHRSLKGMVDSISRLLGSSEAKNREAEDMARQAQQALKEAETARAEADQAKKDGMLMAANKLESVVAVINDASMELSSKVRESEGIVTEQVARVNNTSDAVESMNHAIREMNQNADTASSASVTTRKKAEEGAAVVRKAVDSIHSIQEESLVLKSNMETLGEHAKAISQVMGVISDIADQTNLLALNAAIEAARAGDAGRGFAVVADEVRKLAEKTMASTLDVDRAIKAIQSSAEQNMRQVDRAVQSIQEATGFAQSSGDALTEIVSMVDGTSEQVLAIAAASQQQLGSSDAISRNMQDVSGMASETARVMQDAAQAMSRLEGQGHVLKQLIESFKKV